MVREVDSRGADADVAGYRLEDLLLGQRTVVGDVVRLADRMITIERQQQTLDDVGDVGKGQRVVATADDDALASPQPVCHPPEVQPVARTEERAGPDDHRWQLIVGDHLLYGQ